MLKQLVIQKLGHITPSSLVQLGQQFGLTISENHAKKIVYILKKHDYDIFDEVQRNKLIHRISKEIDPQLAENIQTLMGNFIN